MINTTDSLVVLKHPNFPKVYYTRLHLGMTWCIEIAVIIRNALEPQQSNFTTQFSARHDHPGTSPTTPSPGQRSSSTPSTSSQRPVFTSGFRSSFQQKQTFPFGKTGAQSETMNSSVTVKRTGGTLTFDGTPLKVKQTSASFASATKSKNTSKDDATASAPPSRVASQDQEELAFFSDQSHALSAQGLTTPKSVNIQPAASEHVAFDADIFNNFLPYNPTITEPWESDLSDAMMLDSYTVSSS